MITIINYEIGNTLSVKNAVEKLGYKSEITNSEEKIKNQSYNFTRSRVFRKRYF